MVRPGLCIDGLGVGEGEGWGGGVWVADLRFSYTQNLCINACMKFTGSRIPISYQISHGVDNRLN